MKKVVLLSEGLVLIRECEEDETAAEE